MGLPPERGPGMLSEAFPEENSIFIFYPANRRMRMALLMLSVLEIFRTRRIVRFGRRACVGVCAWVCPLQGGRGGQAGGDTPDWRWGSHPSWLSQSHCHQ